MSSKFIERSPEAEGDKSLILIMDQDGNVTTDPAHFEKLINTKQLPEMGIKIVRLNSSQAENENGGGDDDKSELKLTVEEIYPDSLSLTTSETSNNIMNSTLEMLPGSSNEPINHDMVDPFSQMDPEQLQRLEHALASEQAKQILGENVAAMLDMLSVDESPAAFLQNSIKNDHCYTNLLPSSDPNGPSFFVADVRSNSSDISKGKGKTKPQNTMRSRKIVKAVNLGSPLKAQIVKEVPQHSRQQEAKESVNEFGKAKMKSLPENDDPNYEEEVDIEDMGSEASGGAEEDNLSDEDYNRTGKRGKKKQRRTKKVIVKKQSLARSLGRHVGRLGDRVNKRSRAFQEIRVRNEKLNDEMARVVQSMDYSSKSDEDKSDSSKGIKRVTKQKKKKGESGAEESRVVMETPLTIGDSSSTVKTQQTAKYPKRENRKPPAHLAEAFGPALFSTPDIIRRISTGEDLPHTPSEKKNFTVGVQKNTVLTDAGKLTKSIDTNKPVKTKKAEGVKEAVNHVKAQVKAVSGDGLKAGSYVLKPLKVESVSKAKVTVESIEDKNKIQIPVSSERAVLIKKSNSEIQKLVEKQQESPVKSSTYEEDQDYSDENIEENYYLDPTQMDQSLLESFGQQNCRSEEQLLQEAILLQEQLINSNKNPENEDKPSQAIMTFDETFTDVAEDMSNIVPETIDNIQNEIASSLLLQAHKQALGRVKKAEEGLSKRVTERRASKIGDGQSEEIEPAKESPPSNGNLVVDESKPDERKRNSAKRRRSDEVSDLDSDMDDALSEASWNSEDDPDRLWCICRKPHNNRFMICCDVCEEWFHGKCVGITKTIGKQMEQDGLEWSCPNCTKKKKIDENMKEVEKIKLLKEKMAQSIREQQLKIRESQKAKNQTAAGKEKSLKSGKSEHSELRQTKISDYSQRQLSDEEPVGRKCIMCKGPVRENSIYCSDDCIRKHSQHAISQLMGDSNKKSKSESVGSSSQAEGSKATQMSKKEDSRIIVMDPSSKKILVGQQAPTVANLATWLKENPSYHVVYKKSDKTGKLIMASQKIVKVQKGSGESSQKLIQLPSGQKVSVQQSDLKTSQLKLAVSPNSKQVKIVPSSVNQGKKQMFQIVSSSAGGTSAKPAGYIVRQKQQPEVIDALPLAVKTPPGKAVTKSKSQETTSPRQGAKEAKEAAPEKSEKMQRKRRDKVNRGSAGAAGSKEPKQALLTKSEDGKEKEKRDNDQQIRDSVKKTLADTLKTRVQECKDLEFSDEHINGLADSIEDKLFKHFESKTDTKYKSKYRSLVFNIKDPKNETLFRKILDNSISPKELVKLSPEELASQELARWREKENQHQLEMIKKTELEAMTIGNTYIMKSHKGEQVIESDQSEKVAAVAAEIDPNTPAQELVSALNSVSSTTQDNAEEDEKNKGNTETTLMRMKTREKEHKNSKERERKHMKRGRERSRKRSRSRSRSRRHRSKEKKRSRSRDRSRHRHKDRKSEKKKEKDFTDGSNSPEDRANQKYEKNEITTSEDLQEKAERKQSVDVDDADHEPSSTVNIRTPDINLEESEPVHLWRGSIVMADVAKFSGVATEVSGDCTRLAFDIGEKVDIVGRIPFDTVWDYITRMKRMATKDILVIKIIPSADEEKTSYATLYNYLSKRSRIGVIGKTSEAVKDFYLYPLASHAPIPQVLLPLEGAGLEDDRDNILLGIIVRSKNKMHQRSSELIAKGMPKSVIAEEEQKSSDRSYTPPLPGEEKMNKKDPRLKRKIKVHVDVSRTPVCDEDDDSPYSPGDSDEDLPPLPKVSKPALPGIPKNVTKLLSPVTASQEGLQDPAEIQRKIEEMNRAIEEQTQQIQSLTSTVPKLAGAVPLPNIPLLTGSILTPPPTASPGGNAPHSIPLTSVASNRSENVELPLISSEPEDRTESPARSFTPPIKIEESIPFLPEVTSKISLPSNLQEILNSIQKKSESSDATPAPAKAVEDIVKSNTPDISKAFNVLNQTKGLLTSLSTLGKEEKQEKPEESTAILSRLSDEDIIRKAKEMEMELEQEQLKSSGQEMFPCPPQPLPPGVQDIPMITPGGSYGFALSPGMFSAPEEKNITDADERKPMKKFKLDPKIVFESEGVPDFMAATTSSWEEKKLQKQQKNYKIDIKLTMNSIEHPKNSELESVAEMPQPHKGVEEAKYDVDERILPPRLDEKHRTGNNDGRRRRSDDWEAKRDWKYDRRHNWDDGRRYNKGEYNRRHGGRRFGGGPKFRKERFEDNRDRHLEKEWEGSIKDFEERQRRRNQEIRREELRRLRKRSDSSSN